MEHNTPLSYHFKDKHIWFDMALLGLLFVIASYYPLFKIIPLVASLELFSFFSFHLLGKHSRIHLQGFLGGFISSTAVFLQILNDEKFSNINVNDQIFTLLLALCAMLTECLFIIFFMTDEIPFVFYLPFIAQLVFVILVLFYLRLNSTTSAKQQDNEGINSDLLIDHPIIWKNVAKLSLFIFALVAFLHFIGSELGLSRDLSTLLVAFFEAHAILTSVITEWSIQPQDINLLKLIFLILLGNTLSKSYLAYKGRNLEKKSFFIVLMFTGFVFSLLTTLCWKLLV